MTDYTIPKIKEMLNGRIVYEGSFEKACDAIRYLVEEVEELKKNNEFLVDSLNQYREHFKGGIWGGPTELQHLQQRNAQMEKVVEAARNILIDTMAEPSNNELARVHDDYVRDYIGHLEQHEIKLQQALSNLEGGKL